MIHDRLDYRSHSIHGPDAASFYEAALAEIGRRHGLDAATARMSPHGHSPVFELGDCFVKLAAPAFTDELAAEHHWLDVVDDLALQTPRVLAAGSLEDWRYLVLSRVPGVDLRSAWPQLRPSERLALCRELGEAVAVLHRHGPRGEHDGAGWYEHLARQRARCVEQQRRWGLDAAWLAQIPPFLASIDLEAGPAPNALLHTELMREHVLVEPVRGRWVLRGLIDFESAMIGSPEHDLVGAGLFVCGSDAAAYAAFLTGLHGRTPAYDRAACRRVAAYALLHRHSNLRWFLEQVPARLATLDELAMRVWGAEPAG